MATRTEKYPHLKKAWDAYGHSVTWDELFEVKFYGYYAALSWKEADGSINYADMASGDGINWEMQNDSHDSMPLATWKRGKRVPECDWMKFPGEEEA
jgi:hypothetical protein